MNREGDPYQARKIWRVMCGDCGVRIGAGHGLYVCPHPDPTWQVGTGQAATASTAPPSSEGVQYGIPVDVHSHQLHDLGIYMVGCQFHQPLVAFHTPSHGGHHWGPQWGPWIPPPVRSVWHVHTPGEDVGRTPWHLNMQERGWVKVLPPIHHFCLGSSGDGVLGEGPGYWKGRHLQVPRKDDVLWQLQLWTGISWEWGLNWVDYHVCFSKRGRIPKHLGFFYVAVVQSVFLFWSELWVITPCILW